jgi:hypothetical protein
MIGFDRSIHVTSGATVPSSCIRAGLGLSVCFGVAHAQATQRLNRYQVPNGPVHHPRGKVISDPQVVHNQVCVSLCVSVFVWLSVCCAVLCWLPPCLLA